MSDGKNIVLCCDGTANEFAQDNTNVIKLYFTLVQDPDRQVTFYHPGLGTREATGALTPFSRKVTKLLGSALGYGLADDLRDAYVFLMNTYQDGDKVFLFGFSRGAYTARALASLLYMYGLIRKGNEPLVPYAIRMLTGIGSAGEHDAPDRVSPSFALAHSFKQTMSRANVCPRFVGVWDTVSSVGWIENPLKLPFVTNNPAIEIGRHAVSIDERRAFFRNHLWRRPSDQTKPWGPQNVKQVWFPGVHCDVGGGYPEAESGLSKVALEWMLEEARLAGLLVNDLQQETVLGRAGHGYVQPNPKACPHESLTGAWNIAEFLPKKHFDWDTGRWHRRMNLYRRRYMAPNSLVHESAFERGADYRKRLPKDAQMIKTERAPRAGQP